MRREGSRAPRRAAAVVAAVAAVAAALVAGVVAGCVPSPVAGGIPPGEPGADGPCGSTRSDLWNPVDGTHLLVVFQPTGTGSPWTGGTCDDDTRPAVLLAHGYVGTMPEGYQGLIDHLTANGFVVVFQGYPVAFDPPHQYATVDSGFVQGVAHSGRVDTSRVGVVGHSFGGGMTPWLVQRAADRGWGAAAMWAAIFAPHFALNLPSGPIDLSDHTRVAVVNYEEDVLVDARIGIEIFHALDVPADHKTHVMLLTDRSQDPPLFTDHFGPVSVELLPGLGVMSTDHYDRWSAWRTVDATAGCALDGRWCDTDLSDVGTWPDGRPVIPAIVSQDPQDLGPPALQECEFLLNERPCP